MKIIPNFLDIKKSHYDDELLTFIVGGLEELEKHLNIHDDSSSSTTNSTVGPTTQPTISRSLFEKVKVLSRASGKSDSSKNSDTQKNGRPK